MSLATKIFLLLPISLTIFLVCSIVRILDQKHWESYNRGAHLVELYKETFGEYPSYAFRDAAFIWGDPQDKQDLLKIGNMVYADFDTVYVTKDTTIDFPCNQVYIIAPNVKVVVK